MNAGPRNPPRFVPTLTAVVDLSAPRPLEAPAAAAPQPLPYVLQAESAPPVEAPRPEAQVAVHALTDADAFRIEEDLLHRVLQRVDLSLEERLTEAVSAAVQQQLDAMLPRLREEIETVLRALVIEALARELSENTGSAPSSGASALG